MLRMDECDGKIKREDRKHYDLGARQPQESYYVTPEVHRLRMLGGSDLPEILLGAQHSDWVTAA